MITVFDSQQDAVNVPHMQRPTNAFSRLVDDRLRQLGKNARQACRDVQLPMDLIAHAKTNLAQGKSSKLEDQTLAQIAVALDMDVELLMRAVGEVVGRAPAELYPAFYGRQPSEAAVAISDQLRAVVIVPDPTPEDHEYIAVFKEALGSPDRSLRRAAAQMIRTMMDTWPSKDH